MCWFTVIPRLPYEAFLHVSPFVSPKDFSHLGLGVTAEQVRVPRLQFKIQKSILFSRNVDSSVGLIPY